jgi:hypothetical protein
MSQSEIKLQDAAHDGELIDEISNAIIHLDAAHDRLVQMEEELDNEDQDEADE